MLALEHAYGPGNVIARNQIIRVERQHAVTTTRLNAGVARTARAKGPRRPDKSNAELVRDPGRKPAVRRRIVDDHDLSGRGGLVERRLDRLAEEASLPMARDHDGDERRHGSSLHHLAVGGKRT